VRFPSLPFLAAIAVIATTLPLRSVEFAASGISLPFFNAAGKLTHKLIAKDGAKAGNLQNLRGVEIHYFSATDPTVIEQKLEAEEATWDASKETLVGRGPITVTTEENRVTGEGFDFALATSLLHIHRNFTMTNPEAVMTSDRATVELVVERAGDEVKIRDIKRCEAIGNLLVEIQPTATQTYRFDKLRSNLAIYDGATQTITLPNQIRGIKDGKEGTVSKAEIKLKKDLDAPATSPVNPVK
jgi:hypothetical protein